ncbi:MAG: (2Fe-2S)-binding protein [Gemmatimonas sp.]
MTANDVSPIAAAFNALNSANAAWNVSIERPAGVGWIAGVEMKDAHTGPFNELLMRIGEQSRSDDKLTIAASFALRFGYASAIAIAPYLRFQCVPDISLGNVAFKFGAGTFFERTALYVPRGVVIEGDSRATHPSMTTVPDANTLLQRLREALVSQAAPVVDALYRWSGFAHRGTWGMLTSSWASQFTTFCNNPHDQRDVAPQLDAFFAGDDIVAEMRPIMTAVATDSETHLYQRRASCCRFYLLPGGNLCASCPLVGDDERMHRNVAWLKSQQVRAQPQQKLH